MTGLPAREIPGMMSVRSEGLRIRFRAMVVGEPVEAVFHAFQPAAEAWLCGWSAEEPGMSLVLKGDDVS